MSESAATQEAKARLKTMLENLKAAKALAQEDLTGHDPRTLPGKIARRRQAEEELQELTSGYRTLIRNSFVKIFVTGPRAEEFADVAAKEGVVVVNGADMYEGFARAVEPSVDPKLRQFTPTQLVLLGQIMGQWMETHSVGSLAQPQLTSNEMDVACPEFEDVVNRVRLAIERGNGFSMLQRDLETRICDEALAKSAASMIVPVIITGLTDAETDAFIKGLFGATPGFRIDATTDSADEQLIDDVNTKIRQLFGK